MTTAADDTSTLFLTRRFKASREPLFAAFTDIEVLSKWFGPPGCDVQGGTVDFSVGGPYRILIKTPDGDLIVCGGYREIIPLEKLVFTWRWENDEDWTDLESIVTIQFQARGEDTELQLTHTGFPNAESYNGHEHGWTGCFGKLDALLSA